MRVMSRADHPIDSESVKKQTGHNWSEWFDLLDASGGPQAGRKILVETLINNHGLDVWWAGTITVEYERARGLIEKDGRPKGYSISLTKTIKAEPHRIYEAITKERELDRWLGPKTALDLRVGGLLTNGDGNRALISKIRPGKALRFAWGDRSGQPLEPVEIRLQPMSGRCGLVLTHDRISNRAAADGLRRAWAEALDALKRLLED